MSKLNKKEKKHSNLKKKKEDISKILKFFEMFFSLSGCIVAPQTLQIRFL